MSLSHVIYATATVLAIPNCVKQFDNGKEFSQHIQIVEALKIDFYFADSYSSWQRGTNENTNGLIRQYILKGSDLNDYSDQYIADITTKINHHPRKDSDLKVQVRYYSKNMVLHFKC